MSRVVVAFDILVAVSFYDEMRAGLSLRLWAARAFNKALKRAHLNIMLTVGAIKIRLWQLVTGCRTADDADKGVFSGLEGSINRSYCRGGGRVKVDWASARSTCYLPVPAADVLELSEMFRTRQRGVHLKSCLLYTSDAADE